VTLPARFGGKPQQCAAWRLLPGQGEGEFAVADAYCEALGETRRRVDEVCFERCHLGRFDDTSVNVVFDVSYDSCNEDGRVEGVSVNAAAEGPT